MQVPRRNFFKHVAKPTPAVSVTATTRAAAFREPLTAVASVWAGAGSGFRTPPMAVVSGGDAQTMAASLLAAAAGPDLADPGIVKAHIYPGWSSWHDYGFWSRRPRFESSPGSAMPGSEYAPVRRIAVSPADMAAAAQPSIFR